MAIISWLIFSWLYRENMLDINAARKTTAAELKQAKKTFKKEKRQNQNYLYGKWLWFGSGFYGLAALWTFIVVELKDLFYFIFAFPGFEALFGDGLMSFLIGVIVNQIGNLGSAFTWFHYWPDNSVLVWVACAYLGYMAGIKMAKRTQNVALLDEPNTE
jgi:hypothetical protein